MPKGTFTPAIDCTNELRPDVSLSPIDSRKLHAVGYCPARQLFAAQFTEGGNVYHYEGFTPEQHQAFLAAESKGSHFGQVIQVLPSKKYGKEHATAAAPEVNTAPVERVGELHIEDPDHGEHLEEQPAATAG